jgi:Calx-beta domain
MSFHHWLQNLRSSLARRRGQRHHGRRGSLRTATHRLHLEPLEDRCLLAIDLGYGYEAHPIALEAINLVAGAPGVFSILDGVDDEVAGVDLGDNTFTFYGVDCSGANSLFVSSNGLISFGYGEADYTNTDLSSWPDAPAIAPLWDDWVTYVDASDEVLGKFEDMDGNGTPDRLVIEWNVFHYDTDTLWPSMVTFQAVLGLNAGGLADAIVFNYPDLDTGDYSSEGGSATIGIKDNGPQGPNRLLVSIDSISPFVGTGKALRIAGAVDPQGPALRISDAVSVTEGDSGTVEAIFIVTLINPPTDETVTVDYATADGSGTAGSDYQAASGTLTFAPGETSQTIIVLVNGDVLNEADETFFVNLSSPVNAVLSDGQGAATILNDDPVPTLAINDRSVLEGNSGTTNLVFTVSLSAVSGRPVTVNFLTANGTATASSDYQTASGTLTIPAGQTSAAIPVVVNGDRLAELNETFFVNLSAPTNAVIADAQGVGTILDNEPRVSINDVSLQEGRNGRQSLVFIVTLSAAYDQAVTMSYRTVDGTAKTSDGDYIANTGTLTFAPGETTKTITIKVVGDRRNEGNEVFYLDLFGNSSNSLFTKSRGIGTILNDD